MSKFYPADEVFDLFRTDVESGYPGEMKDWMASREIQQCAECKKYLSLDQFWSCGRGYATCDNCRSQALSPKWLIFPDSPWKVRQMNGQPLLELRAYNERYALILALQWGLNGGPESMLIAVKADKDLAEYEAALNAKGLKLDRKRYPTAAALPANESPERFANIEWMLANVRFETRRSGKQWHSWALFEDPTGFLEIGNADPWPSQKWPADELRLAAHDALNEATNKVQRQEVAA